MSVVLQLERWREARGAALSRALVRAWCSGCLCPGPRVRLERCVGGYAAIVTHQPFCPLAFRRGVA